MNRQFGIEMEIAGINIETNIRADHEDYNHVTRDYWKIVPDSSVRGGFEVVSPILKGESGLAAVEIAARALDDAGATVNSSCGLHVHFDASDLDITALKNILRRYADHETEIDAFMPRSRRGNENTYCLSIREFVNRHLERCASVQELVTSQHVRYFKVNLQSLTRHGTIEFRQHSGTVNAAAIVNWVRFLAAFIERCKTCGATARTAIPNLSGVQGKLAGMFRETGVVTLARIMETFGWLDITARAAITRLRKAGMEIKAVKVDGHAGYMFNGDAGVQPDSLWDGIEPDVALYYQRRAAVLSAAA